MHLSLVLFFSVTYIVVTCQDCKVGGIKCADHEQCCGGCCFNGECVDTYRSCLKDLNVCKDHVCRGEENCVPYRPRRCLGCEPIPLCKLTPDLPLLLSVNTSISPSESSIKPPSFIQM